MATKKSIPDRIPSPRSYEGQVIFYHRHTSLKVAALLGIDEASVNQMLYTVVRRLSDLIEKAEHYDEIVAKVQAANPVRCVYPDGP